MSDVEEALQRTNATAYGLAGAVFTGSKARGIAIAEQMRSGMTSVDSVIGLRVRAVTAFGGVGDSGFGRIHGEDGLKEPRGPRRSPRSASPCRRRC